MLNKRTQQYCFLHKVGRCLVQIWTQNTDYPNWGFYGFLHSAPGEWQGSALNYVVTSIFFSHPFLFIILCPLVVWFCAVSVTGNIIKFNHKQTSFPSHNNYPEVPFCEVHSIDMTFRILHHSCLQVNVFIMIIFYIYIADDNDQDQIQNSLNTICLCLSIDH